MSLPSQKELSSRQLDMSLEPRIEVWFENTNLEVISMQMAFYTIEIHEVRREETRREKRTQGEKETVKQDN